MREVVPHKVLVEPRRGGAVADSHYREHDRRVGGNCRPHVAGHDNGAPNGGSDGEGFSDRGRRACMAAGTSGRPNRDSVRVGTRRASGRGVVRGAGSSSNATPLRWWLHLLLVFGFSCIMHDHDGDHIDHHTRGCTSDRTSDRTGDSTGDCTNEPQPFGPFGIPFGPLYTGHGRRGGLLLAEAATPNDNYPQKKYDFESWPDYQFTRRYDILRFIP